VLFFLQAHDLAVATGRHIRRAAVAPVAPQVVDLSPAAKEDLQLLLQDLNIARLANSTFVAKPNEPIETFVPKCLSHVRQLVKKLDRSYTDVQLETVLIHDCQLSLHVLSYRLRHNCGPSGNFLTRRGVQVALCSCGIRYSGSGYLTFIFGISSAA